MNPLSIFIIEVLLCFGISVIVIMLLKPLLHGVLTETCGTEKRADFWVMFTQIMLIISPLLLVIYFAPIAAQANPNIAEEIKNTLFRSLLGEFIGLAAIGQIIWKSISQAGSQITAGKPLTAQESHHAHTNHQ